MKKYIIWICLLTSESCTSEYSQSSETLDNASKDNSDRVLSRETRDARQIHSANDANFLNPFNWLQVVRTVSQMKGEVRTLSSTVEQMSATIADHENNRNEVNTRDSTKEDTKAITDIQTNIMNIYQHIKALRTKLKKKGSKIKLQNAKQKAIKVNMKEKELNQTLITVEATIEKVNKTVEEFIPMVNVTAIQGLLTQLSDSSVTELITNLTAKVTAMETEVTSLKTKNTALETEVAALKTKDTALETKQTATEACFGDITSSDCPASTSGKTGVIAGIQANTAALASKCDTTTCTATTTKVTKIETCFGDTSSSDCLGTTGTGLIKSIADHQTCFTDKSSSTCPASASGKTGIKAAITDLEEGPMFSCTYQGNDITPTGNGGTISCTAASADCIILYTSCDVNQGITTGVTTDTSVSTSTGKFTVPKAGRYRLTFMGMLGSSTNKKGIVVLKKKLKSDSSIVDLARGLVQNKLNTATSSTGNFYVSVSIDVIRDLAKDDEVYMLFNLGTSTLLNGKAAVADQIVFTGQLVSLIP